MARATTKKASTRSPRAAAGEDAPKRRPGRPLGSTNAKKPPAARSRRTAKPAAASRTAKDAPRAPKMNKAELEAEVTKLERTIARLRSKNKELKLAANEAREHADVLEAQLTSRSATTGAKPPRQSRRRTGRTSADSSGSDEDAGESSQD
jgi:RNA polymerase primary sigma factor